MFEGVRGMIRNGNPQFIPTYTLQEILDKLPREINKDGSVYNISIYKKQVGEHFLGKKLFDDAYKTLVWLLENGYLK